MPGTDEYYDIKAGEWKKTDGVNKVGNTTGGSWSGVISKFSDAPDCTYFLLALMATKEKSTVYAYRGWDGVDPGRISHYLPPNGTNSIDGYVAAGWDAKDAEQYTNAYFNNFGAAQQFPYLRIPGTFEYWTALDVHLSEAATGQKTPEEALKATVDDFNAITDRLGARPAEGNLRQVPRPGPVGLRHGSLRYTLTRCGAGGRLPHISRCRELDHGAGRQTTTNSHCCTSNSHLQALAARDDICSYSRRLSGS